MFTNISEAIPASIFKVSFSTLTNVKSGWYTHYSGNWICRGGPLKWPPKSPDVSPYYYDIVDMEFQST
jgi:hypothetical protein